MFLPCGHHKVLSPNEIVVIDELFKEACERLSIEHRMNENILKLLRSRIYYLMENKLPDVYRCKQLQEGILGECGHFITAECWEVRCYNKRSRKLICNSKVEKILSCGHSEEVQCSISIESIICKEC